MLRWTTISSGGTQGPEGEDLALCGKLRERFGGSSFRIGDLEVLTPVVEEFTGQ